MIENIENRNLINEKILSIFEPNLIRRINFNSFINNKTPPINLNDKYYNDKQKRIKQISKFNPYDSEIDYKYNDIYNNKKLLKYNQNNENQKVDNNVNNNIIYCDYKDKEGIEGNNNQNLGNFINISSKPRVSTPINKVI